MNHRIRQAMEVAAMVTISAILYVEFFHLNDLIFSTLEHVHGVNWVFLPAGFRVLLVLIMGLPGAAGILLGNCWLDRASLNDESLWLVLITGMVSGLTPWCVKWVMEKKQLLARQLKKLTAHSLLQFVLAYAMANAVGHQLVWWALKVPDSNPWVDVWPMFVGDAVGALLILYTMKWMLPALADWGGRFRKKPPAKTRPAGH